VPSSSPSSCSTANPTPMHPMHSQYPIYSCKIDPVTLLH
jgi:hypothetical protein